MSTRRERRSIEKVERRKFKKFCALYNALCDQPWVARLSLAVGIIFAKKTGAEWWQRGPVWMLCFRGNSRPRDARA